METGTGNFAPFPNFLSCTCNFKFDLCLFFFGFFKSLMDWIVEPDGSAAGAMVSSLCFPSVILLLFGNLPPPFSVGRNIQ